MELPKTTFTTTPRIANNHWIHHSRLNVKLMESHRFHPIHLKEKGFTSADHEIDNKMPKIEKASKKVSFHAHA